MLIKSSYLTSHKYFNQQLFNGLSGLPYLFFLLIEPHFTTVIKMFTQIVWGKMEISEHVGESYHDI